MIRFFLQPLKTQYSSAIMPITTSPLPGRGLDSEFGRIVSGLNPNDLEEQSLAEIKSLLNIHSILVCAFGISLKSFFNFR